ncbi:MAG: carbohydrate ABC transporter permease [Acutalibacteraceae bacterium]
MKIKRKLSVEDAHNLKGLWFVLPFIIGVIFFYVKPIAQSISFSFNEVVTTLSGFEQKFIGLDNYNYIFKQHESFTTRIVTDFLNMLWKTPMIVVLSLFFALLLNREFPGRTFVRAVFFLPVIFSNGVILEYIQSDLVVSSTLSSTSLLNSGPVTNQTMGLQQMLLQSGINEEIVAFVTDITNNFFSLIWNSGIQTLIFLSGLQSVSGSLYEAASVEGASWWESFCKITIPMMAPMILLNTVYTIVDSYFSAGNGVMNMIIECIRGLQYGRASAMAWVYFVFIGVILGIVALIFKILSRSASKN